MSQTIVDQSDDDDRKGVENNRKSQVAVGHVFIVEKIHDVTR